MGKAFLLAAFLGAMPLADAQVQAPRAPADGERYCLNGYCITTEVTLDALDELALQAQENAARAEQFAMLCGWVK